ncbi:hypothetical protein EJ08DRAFT_647793 [Tothia fuscella]|uniref:Uncharacterized protein n=1 Tax=Tothia fuscella TaxID=1048955 RepID=A0A9P4U171_9PEZI|nr:hypothetical protein EJ08DRAFT_647793 [Tothia fuscella]
MDSGPSTPTPSLRGGDASHQRDAFSNTNSLPVSQQALLSFTSQGQSVVDFSPLPPPQDIPKIAHQVKQIGEQLEEFPSKLDAHRESINETSAQAVSTYSEVLGILRSDVEGDEHSTADQKSMSLEAIDLLKDQFEVVSDLCSESQEFLNTHFFQYKQLLHDQFNAVLALERANMQHGLAMYQQQLYAESANNVGNANAIAQLQQTLSNLTLRSGLMITEKKAAEEHAALAKQNAAYAQQDALRSKQEVARIQQRVDQLEVSKEDYTEQLSLMESRLRNAESANEHIKKSFEAETEKVRQLTLANSKLKEEPEKGSSPHVAGKNEDNGKWLSGYNASVKALEEKKSALVSAKKAVEALQKKDNDNMILRQREASKHASEVKMVADKFSDYRQSVEESFKDNERLLRDMAKKDNEIAAIKSSLENIEKQYQEAQTVHAKYKVEIWDLKQRVSGLESSKANLAKAVAVEQVACDKRGAEVQKLQSWNAELEDEKVRLELVIKNLKQQFGSHQLDGSIDSFNASDYAEKLVDLQEEINVLDSLNQVKTKQIEDLTYQLSSTRSNSTDLATQLASEKRHNAQQTEDMMVFRELIAQGRYDVITPGVEVKLRASGLHKHHPLKKYVSPEYYSRIERQKRTHIPDDIKESAIMSARDLEPIFWEDGI